MKPVTTSVIRLSAATCPYCGMIHGPRCPSVQAIEYYPDGTVKRVEFVKPVAAIAVGSQVS